MKYSNIVDPKDWRNMTGATDVLKKLNAALTIEFILSDDVPDDECWSEAEHVHGIWCRNDLSEGKRSEVAEYVRHQFAVRREVDPAFVELTYQIVHDPDLSWDDALAVLTRGFHGLGAKSAWMRKG